MGVAAKPILRLDDTFARSLEGLYANCAPVAVEHPSLLVLNDALALELGLDPEALRSPEGVSLLVGNTVADGSAPLAQAYAGHQFGGYSPRLGDGRAHLLGEIVGPDGERHDLHLKGSGRTPFARGGDGRAAVGPMLREYLMGEAMHALGIPTTRALGVVATGEQMIREVDGRGAEVPGAVLSRIASSHLRVGTFQYASATGDGDLLRQLCDYAIQRHCPEAARAGNPALALYDHVVEVQARLVSMWMHVGFIHGVLNTDNVTISGETIDYGPCAFMEKYDPATVFSSIDHGGRYAYGSQPAITTWNLARLGEAMLPLFDADADAAVELVTSRLQRFPELFHGNWISGMRAKIGLAPDDNSGDELVGELLTLMTEQHVDYTTCLRSLSSTLRGSDLTRSLFDDPTTFDAWAARWRASVTLDAADAMDRLNPIYIPRNHLVEEALTAATSGDQEPFDRLLAAVTSPFVERAGNELFATPAPSSFSTGYQTFCGT